ncbi:uncharacterized protein BO97DRAFT_195108 [Aspergillus homomorphus CBS 101889]|uniref:Uncharacterized protein n=1 Tax=Aspergillus homomorphus (strain CBS 101889) TaxID=1450537 RepID=A0A395HPF4_ASPHC|nr:hypothetical protein BO97DRAFT_195108 [Aspergillus homomorphus CBS 101889]RAL08738.1 hypothetical protein BO97DRAFT_195108 [Aspergillus homomorphus CBS 101889]
MLTVARARIHRNGSPIGDIPAKLLESSPRLGDLAVTSRWPCAPDDSEISCCDRSSAQIFGTATRSTSALSALLVPPIEPRSFAGRQPPPPQWLSFDFADSYLRCSLHQLGVLLVGDRFLIDNSISNPDYGRTLLNVCKDQRSSCKKVLYTTVQCIRYSHYRTGLLITVERASLPTTSIISISSTSIPSINLK